MSTTAEKIIAAAQQAISAATKVDPRMTSGELLIGISSLLEATNQPGIAEEAGSALATSLVQLVGARRAVELVRSVEAAGGGSKFS